MALPTLVKTWRFCVNNNIPVASSLDETHRNIWWAIYNLLRGRNTLNTAAVTWTDSAGSGAAAPSALWTTRSSCNSVTFGNNNNIDNLLTLSDIVHSSGISTPRSWYALENTAVGAYFTSAMGDEGFGSSPYLGLPTPGLSAFRASLRGYGTANGGTNGNAGDPPLAASGEDIPLFSSGPASISSAAGAWLGVPTVLFPHKIHVMASSDGRTWRLFVCRNGHVVFFLNLEVPQNPVVIPGAPDRTWNGYDKPFIGWVKGSAAEGLSQNPVQYAYWLSSLKAAATSSANATTNTLKTTQTVSLGGERSVIDPSAPLWRIGVSELTNSRPFAPISVINENPGYRGRMGILTDIWWGNDSDLGVSTGDTYPADTSRQFAALGTFILPWNGTVMQTT